MAEPITIDILAQVKNNTKEGANEAVIDLQKIAKEADKASSRLVEFNSVSQKAGKSVKESGEQAEDAQKSMEGLGKSSDNASKGLDGVEQSSKKTKTGLDGVDKSGKQARRTLLELAKEKVAILIEAKDQLSPFLKEAGSGLKGLTAKAWSVPLKILDYATTPIRGVINLLKNPIIQGGAILGLSFGVKDTVDTFSDFEAAMSQVKAISGADKDEFAELTEKAKFMGASTKFTATESAEAFNYMAMAGWKTKDMLDGIEGIMSLAAASGENLATTSDIVTDALTAFGLNASDSGHFADVLAQASANANTNVAMLGESFKYVAPVAGAMGYEVEDVSLALGLMANASVKGSMAGTSLKTSLANMAAPTKNMAKAMKQYGISLTDSKGKMKDLKGVLDNLRSSLGGISETEQTAAASKIFGKEAMAGMLAIINASEEDYNKLTEAVNNADGASKRMADTMLDNLQGAFTLLQSAADGVKLSLGERFKPYIMELATWLTDQMPRVEEGLMRFMDFVDEKVDSFKRKIAGFTSTREWESADLFGKIKIAWDEIIMEPLNDWLNDSGRIQMNAAAKKIGIEIGEAITAGVGFLFGSDPGDITREGMSLGASFVEGFVGGIDGNKIKKAIMNAIKTIFADSYFGGGGTNTSILSTLAVGFAGTKLVGGGIGLTKGTIQTVEALKILTGLFQTGGSEATGAAAGAGGVSGAAGASTGAVAAAGISTSAIAGIAGAAMGVIGIKSGINHFNKASKIYADDAEREKQKRTGKTKIGMVGTGLAAGAAIGSILPGIGTIAGGLIGAGAGGLGAMLGGEVISSWLGGLMGSKDAQEKVLADMGNNLRDAVNEYTRITSQNDYARRLIKEYEDLAEAMNDPGLSNQQAVQIQERMQDIGLQLHEIFPDLINDYDVLNGRTGERIRLLKEEANFMDASAKRHLQQSVTDARTKLPELQKEIPELEKKIEAASGQYESSNQFRTELYKILREAQEVYDNPLSTPEQLTQANTMVVSRANELSSSLGRDDSFKDYGDVTKTYHSLKSETEGLIEELDNLEFKLSEAQQSLQSYYDSSVQLIWSDTGIDMDQFQSTKKNLESLQKAMIELVQNGSVSKETETLVNEILPGFSMAEDAASQMDLLRQGIERMKDSIQPAIDQIDELNTSLERLPEEKKIKVSIEAQGIIPIPGKTGLDVIPSTAITELMSGVAKTIPQSMQEQIVASFSDVDMSSAYEAIDFIGPFSNEVYEQMAAAELTAAMNPLKGAVQTGILASLSTMELSNVGSTIGKDVGSAIQNTDMEPILSSIGTLKEDTGIAIDSAFSSGFSTETPVMITAKYSLANPSAQISFSGGGTGTATVTANILSTHIGKHAEGGFTQGPELSWIGEDGKEAIIPLSGKYRKRGLELYEKVGQYLGVGYHAEGSIFDSTSGDPEPAFFNPGATRSVDPVSRGISAASGTNLTVHVSANPETQIHVNGGNSIEEIMDRLRQTFDGMTDQLLADIAKKIFMVSENMPGGAV